jgi:hypothetical protein
LIGSCLDLASPSRDFGSLYLQLVCKCTLPGLAGTSCTTNTNNNNKLNKCMAARVTLPRVVWQGYIFGGLVAGPLGWRAAFLLEAAAMSPFVAFCALAPPIHLRGMSKGARWPPRAVT